MGLFKCGLPNNDGFQLEWCASLSEAEPSCLKLLDGATYFLQPNYLKAMEQGAPTGVHFRYVWVLEKKKPIAFFYFQVALLDVSDVGSIVNLQPYSKSVRHLSQLITTLLFGKQKSKPHYLLINGNMCLSGNYGSHYLEHYSDTVARALPEVIKAVNKELEKSYRCIATIVKDLPLDHDPFTAPLKRAGWNPFRMDPVMKMNIPSEWKSFEDYLAALSSKYRVRTSNILKKRNGLEIRDLTLKDLDVLAERMQELYTAVQDKSPIRLLHPDMRYIKSLAANMGKQVHFRGIFDGEKLIAFMTGICDGKEYEAHHIGMDYETARDLALYQNILYEYIRLAIEAGASVLSFGRTAIEMKSNVGAVPEQLNVYLKLNNRVLNHISGPFLPQGPAKEWIQRDPFKNGHKAN